jgi:hypothetical protein
LDIFGQGIYTKNFENFVEHQTKEELSVSGRSAMPSTVAVFGHFRLNASSDRIGVKRHWIKRFKTYRMECKQMTVEWDSLVSFKKVEWLPRNAAPFQSGKSATRKIYFVPPLHPESTFNFLRNQLRARPAE